MSASLYRESENFIVKLSYKIADETQLTLKSTFGAPFIDKQDRTHINGDQATQSEVEGAFVNSAMRLAPKPAQIDKLNAAQFSKMFKGTFLTKLQPSYRGLVNKGVNKIVSMANGLTIPKQITKRGKERSD